jgi:hypothetical protein
MTTERTPLTELGGHGTYFIDVPRADIARLISDLARCLADASDTVPLEIRMHDSRDWNAEGAPHVGHVYIAPRGHMVAATGRVVDHAWQAKVNA